MSFEFLLLLLLFCEEHEMFGKSGIPTISYLEHNAINSGKLSH